jgi:coproporphyrinogen III oxidase-like Fe-S oxidoreductase
MISEIFGFVTRREGKKFLKLNPEIDSNVITGAGVDEGMTLYVHIPFCRTLCPFCCFNRYLFDRDKAKVYFKSLKKELDLYVERGFRFSEFYFGGGTPTILMDELTGFIGHLKRNFEVKRISVETTPRELNRQNIVLLKEAGVRRLSVGVQSFNDGLLKSMGRLIIMGDEVKSRLSLAQGEFETLNIDLLFNFPGQSEAELRNDIKTVRELGIDQVTFYPLMASPHKKDALERSFNRVDTAREKRFYEVILEEMAASGYRASTSWCFSRGDRMIDEYIVDTDDYVGIGSGSVSMVKGNFFINTFSLERYGEIIESGKLPIIGTKKLSAEEHQRYYLLTKLFGMKLDGSKFRNYFHSDLGTGLGKEMLLLKFFDIVRGKEKLTVTQRGMYPVSVMMREFFSSLNTLREHCIENQI